MSGTAIRERRIELEMSQRQLARATGMALSHVKRVEAGLCQPYDYTARKFARVLECTVEDFSTLKPGIEAA